MSAISATTYSISSNLITLRRSSIVSRIYEYILYHGTISYSRKVSDRQTELLHAIAPVHSAKAVAAFVPLNLVVLSSRLANPHFATVVLVYKEPRLS